MKRARREKRRRGLALQGDKGTLLTGPRGLDEGEEEYGTRTLLGGA